MLQSGLCYCVNSEMALATGFVTSMGKATPAAGALPLIILLTRKCGNAQSGRRRVADSGAVITI